MAELLPQERLQPSLLDRLIDEAPDKKTEPREHRVLTKQQLRRAVLRDIAWLFNATRHDNLAQYPHADASVINYGLPALSGETASTLDVQKLENAIRQAILTFEPRLIPSTLKVQAVMGDIAMDQHNVIGVEIRGNLWAQPVPLEMLLRTEVDLETGKVEVRELAS